MLLVKLKNLAPLKVFFNLLRLLFIHYIHMVSANEKHDLQHSVDDKIIDIIL